jgi:hypothetical protein
MTEVAFRRLRLTARQAWTGNFESQAEISQPFS